MGRRAAAPGRPSHAQSQRSSRSMDRGVGQCGAAFRARIAFSACGWSGSRPIVSRGSGVRQPQSAIAPSAIHDGDETRISPSSIAPVVVFGKRGNLDLLVAVDAAAERLGLTTGLALAQARAMHPALVAMPEDQAADARLLAAVADWCQRYTPLVAADPPDGILLDIGGCAHLFGGEQRLCDDLLARMTDFGFSTRIAIATTIGAAWAAARFSDVTIDGNRRRTRAAGRRCRSPRCGCRPTWLPRWRASA